MLIHRSIIFVVILLASLTGCASTKFETSGAAPTQALCEAKSEHISALVLWGTQWRADQKDITQREAAAQQGIEQFFAQSGCYSQVQILRTIEGRPAIELSENEIRQLALSLETKPTKLLVIVVRELGPVVKLLSSAALIEGGTEVVLDIQAKSLNQQENLAAFKAHWKNGGLGVIKGVATLADDMRAALYATLKPESSRSN